MKTIAAPNAPPDPSREREAWKLHFQKLQEGRETVEESVWDNVKSEPSAEWLADEPTSEEIHTCAKQMRNGKAAGSDGFMAEFYKYGGSQLQEQIQGLVKIMWHRATSAIPGQEAMGWPESWSQGIVIPLFKNKGNRNDKNQYRGITLLSVGSKLLARVVAQRVQKWSEAWLAENQSGFRKNRSVDDVLQVTRRIVEEATATHAHPEVLLIRLFDIEKAYPRVSRDSLWRLMSVKGAPEGFIRICKGLHEHTVYQVRIHKGTSSPYSVDKGLREGCPSSPPLFNVFHHGVLEDYRLRRQRQAQAKGWTPGIPWTSKITGRCDHDSHSRTHLTRNSEEVCLGDIGFADDTCLLGESEEMALAEPLLEQTMVDWREKVHPGKTEGLRLQFPARNQYDVRYKGEAASVRHVGGILDETGGHHSDTQAKKAKAFLKIGATARAWFFGTRRQSHRQFPHSLRVKIMKAVIMPTLTCFGKSRSWSPGQIKQMERVINWAAQRCLLIRHSWKRQHHVNSEMIRELVQWEPFATTMARQCLFWLGHVARMHKSRLPKQALFGFWRDHGIRPSSPFKQGTWLKQLLAQIQQSEMDWFRVAQDRQAWQTAVLATFPITAPDSHRTVILNRWTLASGRPQLPPPQFQHTRQQRHRYNERNATTGQYHCAVCDQQFAKVPALRAHYDAEHSVADPDGLQRQTKAKAKERRRKPE